MKKSRIVLAIQALILALIISSCASNLSPSASYAKKHHSKEFQGWKAQNKKMDKDEKRKPKEHQKRNKY